MADGGGTPIQEGIEIQTNFDLKANKPLDRRFYGIDVDNTNKYAWMLKIDREEGRIYQLRPKNGILHSNEDYDTDWEFIDIIIFFTPEIVAQLLDIVDDHEERLLHIESLMVGITEELIITLNGLDIRLDNIETWKITIDNYIVNILSRLQTAEANIIINSNCIQYIISILQQMHINASAVHNLTAGIQGGVQMSNNDISTAEHYHLSQANYDSIATNLANLVSHLSSGIHFRNSEVDKTNYTSLIDNLIVKFGADDDTNMLNELLNYILSHFNPVSNGNLYSGLTPVSATNAVLGHVKLSNSIILNGTDQLTIPTVTHDRTIESLYKVVMDQTAPVIIRTELATNLKPYIIDVGGTTFSIAKPNVIYNDVCVISNTARNVNEKFIVDGYFENNSSIRLTLELVIDNSSASHFKIVKFSDINNNIIADFDLVNQLVVRKKITLNAVSESLDNRVAGEVIIDRGGTSLLMAKQNTTTGDGSMFVELPKLKTYSATESMQENLVGMILTDEPVYAYSSSTDLSYMGLDLTGKGTVGDNYYCRMVDDYETLAPKIKNSIFDKNDDLYIDSTVLNIQVRNCAGGNIIDCRDSIIENVIAQAAGKYIFLWLLYNMDYKPMTYDYTANISNFLTPRWHPKFNYAVENQSVSDKEKAYMFANKQLTSVLDPQEDPLDEIYATILYVRSLTNVVTVLSKYVEV